MMASMGWTEGRGLGKDEQGMLNPLIAKKSAGSTGIIVESQVPMYQEGQIKLPEFRS